MGSSSSSTTTTRRTNVLNENTLIENIKNEKNRYNEKSENTEMLVGNYYGRGKDDFSNSINHGKFVHDMRGLDMQNLYYPVPQGLPPKHLGGPFGDNYRLVRPAVLII